MVGQWCEGGNGGSVVLGREWWVSGVREGMVGQWCGREWWVSGVGGNGGSVV